MTHTFATLEVSAAAYDEIMLKLRDAGYEHAILSWAADHGRKDVIDMHGIGLVRKKMESSESQQHQHLNSNKE